MGVDIQTYRARIGTYSTSRGGDVITIGKQVNIRDGVKTIGCFIFIGILLVMAGIELNPGPREKELSKILESINVPNVKISGLNENINKDMLDTFFEVEEKNGGGKIKTIYIDSNNKCATLTFKEKNDFDAFMNRKPRSIFGNEVTVEIIDTTHIDTNVESTRIKISGLMEHINKEMLELFFEKEQSAGGGKVKYIDIDIKNKCVFVDFEEKSGVQWIMKKTPLSIFGMKVHTEIVETDIGQHKMIKITKLPEFINKEMLKMFFENKTDCSGNVVELTVTSDENYAIVVFDDAEAVNRILAKRPLTIFEYKVDVDILDLQPPKILEPLNIPRVRITGLTEYVNKEMLEMFFQNEERHGGGKAKCIHIDNKNASATIDFYEKAGIDAFMKRKPKSIFGMEVTVELIGVGVHSEEPRKIKITKLPIHINSAMLTMFFESKRNYVGNVLDVTVDTEHHFAIVEFDNPTAVSKVMDKKPFTIFECEVDVNVCDDKVSSETKPAERSMQMEESLQTTVSDTSLDDELQDFPRLRIPRQMENLNMEMLARYSEHSEKKSERKVKDIDMGMFATIDIEEKAVSTDTERELFNQILQRLGLTDTYPGKISMRDVIAVDPNESIEQVNGKISFTDIPWLILKRLICAHSESRDIRVSEEENTENSLNLEDALSSFSEIQDENQDISPLDIFTVVFQCCDPFLKQIFVQKLYLCKLAVPFLYRYLGTNEKLTSVLSIWPLRSLAIESKQRTVNKNEIQGRENDVLDMQTKVLAFGRLGRPRYSKSKLINSLLLSQGCKTFFNIDCPSGMTPRQLSNGQIEMFWLPTIDERKDRFQDALTMLNLRGDLSHDFSQDLLCFVSHFVDSIVIIIDLDTVLERSKMVKDVLLQFSSVILIIADPLNRDAVKLVQTLQTAVMSSSKSEINLRILSTHKGTIEQNVVDMISSITKTISNQLKNNNTMSLEDRLSRAKLAKVKTDEEEEVCQQGKIEATKLIKQMKTEGDPSGWKQQLTPVHGIFSKQLGKLLKERERERDFTKGDNLNVKITTVRRQQIASITKTVRFFLDILIKNNSSPSVVRYFLCWLHFFIEREKRRVLPQLMHANRCAWEKLKILKSAENQVKEAIKDQETAITDLEEKIDEASFAVQHFFREIGHINEAILELNEETAKLGLPNLHQMSSIIGRLVADGHPLELIDGESFYMPYLWIKKVMKMVDLCIESSKVMTLGVLGLQSSGKSTLLNTMFGSQFSSRTGRCTRGIHVQLIPTKTKQFSKKSSYFSFVLIVDTEGLRSPELSHVQHEHDNELATVITGVGDVTMLNIMGENTSEIRDILQVIVHAFLRLKMTNQKLDIRKSCAFIHQNVTDTSASENMVSGLSKLMQTLDEMTKESARSEGIMDITTFNQVIEFDIKSQVWYLKNLWQGNPPMARVNNEYSETVVDIKCKILKKALTMKNKSYKSLNDIVEQAHSLWKGVLNEDFVFSFRNSLEIKAYMEMEAVVQDELWRLESLIRDKLIQISQNSFATVDRDEDLRDVADNLIRGLNEYLSNEKIKTEANIETYFDGNKYKDVIIQWKNIQETRVTMLCDKLQQIIKEHVEKSQVKRSLEILTVTCQGKHEEKLRKRSMDVANQYKGQELSGEKIDHLFNQIWESFLSKVNTSPTSREKHRKKMRFIFLSCLENIFKKHHALLKEHLKETDSLTPLPKVKQLANSFRETRINDTDISLTFIQNVKTAVGWSDTMEYVGGRVNQIFESVDGKIKEICQVNDEVTEMSVNKFMHELGSSIQAILTKESKYRFKKTFDVKIFVHVCRHVHPIFESHNEKYFKTHGTAILLEKYRELQKISFESHLRCRQFEDIVAKLFAHVIQSFAEEWTSQSLPNRVTDELLSLLPEVKNRVIIVICTDLLKKGNFEDFVKYIVDPYMYASSWITEKANKYLDDSKSPVIASTASSLLKKLFSTVNNCVRDVETKYDGKPPISIGTWLESFQITMKSSDYCIPSESFRNVRQETSSKIQNLEYLTATILDHLSKSEEKLAAKFKSQTSQTITWASFNPISRIIKKIWGCQEQCPFCGEPCAKSQDHGDSNHYSIQHRPSCCKGICESRTNEACLESCEFDIQSNTTHRCSVFNYICGAEEKTDCGKTHFYRDYKTYLPNWDIAPTSNMHDSSKYWMWFVATYRHELKEYYKYDIGHIPSSWNKITDHEAEQSLHKIYSA